MIDANRLCEIANQNTELLLASLNLDYIKEGGYIAIKCVFHEGNNYNLRFKIGGSFWYCFSKCQRKYSIINIVMKVLDLEFIEAVNWLKEELGLNSGDIEVTKEKIRVKEKLKKMKAMKAKKNHVEYEPLSNEVLNDFEDYIHPYMLNKGVREKTFKHFGVGYARFGPLAGRVTIPIDSLSGDIISASGRLPITGKTERPKYKKIGGTNTDNTLYNISRINKDKDYIVVVEGFWSVWSLYEYGVENVVALMGAFLSKMQLKLLLANFSKIIVIGDNDKAGKRMNQMVINQCSKFAEVYKIDVADFGANEGDSPCEKDIGFDNMSDLVERIEEIIDG